MSTPIIVSPRDYFFQVRAELLKKGVTPAESRKQAFAAQQAVFGAPKEQRALFGAPQQRQTLFRATSLDQLKFTTPRQSFVVARQQLRIAGQSATESRQNAIAYTRSLPRESFTAKFTEHQEFLFALSKSPEASALRIQARDAAIAAGLSRSEAVGVGFGAAREFLGFAPLETQQAAIQKFGDVIVGQSRTQASQDSGGIIDTSGSGGLGGGGGGFGLGEQQGIGGGLGILLLLGLAAYEASRKGKGKKR